MSTGTEQLLTSGHEALATGAWATARDAFQTAIDRQESAEGLRGLADAMWWLGEVGEAVALRERAYAAFRRRGELIPAVSIAVRLCVDYRSSLGNVAASSGWLGRATRLVEEHGLDPLQGWILLMKAFDSADPTLGEKWAREAYELARAVGDLDLELCALAQLGAALIDQGRVEAGVAFLDEAMSGSLAGEGENRDSVVFTSCHMITSCSRCADFERAVQWVRAADQFTEHYGCPFLYTFCRTLYGGVLVDTGEWEQAEEELGAAVEMSRTALSGLHGQALAFLAGLRLAQGPIEEAEQLVSGLEDHPAATPVLAAIHLQRGEPALAATMTTRTLEQLGENRLDGAILSELLGEAEIAQEEIDLAADRGQRLAFFAPDLAECVAFGDDVYAQFAQLIRRVAEERGISLGDLSQPAPWVGYGHETLELTGFGSVIHATGFRPDYSSWIDAPEAFDDLGFPIQDMEGIGPVPGLHFVGVHFLRKRKSALFSGVGEDASIVVNTVASHLPG